MGLKEQVMKQMIKECVAPLENLLSGINEKIKGIKDFTLKIVTVLNSNATDEQHPTAKAVFDFVRAYVKEQKQIPVLQNPKLWELENGWYYVSDGFYYTNEKYIELSPEGLLYIQSNEYYNFYVWELDGKTYKGGISITVDGPAGWCKETDIDKQIESVKIKTLVSPNIWELDYGLYRVRQGCYYGNNDDGEFSPPTPKNYKSILGEALLFVYEPSTTEKNGGMISSFYIIEKQCFCYGNITKNEDFFDNEGNKVIQYIGDISKRIKTTAINENSTDEQEPTAKAVYDLVQEALYVDEGETV